MSTPIYGETTEGLAFDLGLKKEPQRRKERKENLKR
jgi:hypothetical protein